MVLIFREKAPLDCIKLRTTRTTETMGAYAQPSLNYGIKDNPQDGGDGSLCSTIP